MYTVSNTLGERIRLLRKERGYSQEQLALKAEMAPSFIGEIERSAKKPSIESIEKISNALEISVSELFDYDLQTCETTLHCFENKIFHLIESCPKEEQELLCCMLEYALQFKKLAQKK